LNNSFIKWLTATSICFGSSVSLKDIHYSIKQNGVMVSLDYSGTIKDDDIIAWKSDRGWVYLTLLGVRAPLNKFPQQSYKRPVKKIVIDDFNESIQVAILINKPILGYDILNSKTSPGTVVFIHTEMKHSEVTSLKSYINDNGASVFNVAQSSGFPQYDTNFKNAFDQARSELGPNSIFEFHGKLYTTNHPGETESMFNPGLAPIENEKTKDLDELLTNSVSPIEEIYVDITTDDVFDKKMGATDIVVNKQDIQNDTLSYTNIDKTQLSNEDNQQLSVIPDFTEEEPSQRKLGQTPRKPEVTVDDFSMEIKNEPKEKRGWFRKIFPKIKDRKQQDKKIQKLSNELAVAANDLSSVKKIDEDGELVMSDYSQPDSEKPKAQLEQIVIHEPEVVADVQEVMDYELSGTQEPDFNKNDGWAMSDYPNYDNENFNRQNFEKGTNNTIDFALLPEPETISASSNEIKDRNTNVVLITPLDPYDESLVADVMPIEEPMESEYKNTEKLYPSQVNLPQNLTKEIPDEILMQQKWYPLQSRKMSTAPSGIRVTANREGVPIYIDGKLVGETPLAGPVKISPGWHQVSGLTPLYAKVLNRSGMEYVDDDPILRNNQLFGSRTVYVGPKNISVVNLRFNDIGDPPRHPFSLRDLPQNMADTEGGMMIGFPVIMALFGFITWGMI
tara:strand:- start:593 stop:2614 length:2022 start_codon:yes stop_codon:yes gene_type:complete